MIVAFVLALWPKGEDIRVADEARQRFEEQIRSLISERRDGGESTTHIDRIRVEEIGKELGMAPRDACVEFFALRGSGWDVVDLEGSTIYSSESSALPPPRNWLAINDIYLIT
jgi:hypothetical protein